jgi:hypothetical protein
VTLPLKRQDCTDAGTSAARSSRNGTHNRPGARGLPHLERPGRFFVTLEQFGLAADPVNRRLIRVSALLA